MSGNRGRHARGRPAPVKPDLRLNFLPVTPSADSFDGSVLPYESAEQLRALRAEYGATHVLRRNYEDEIECVSLVDKVPMIGTPRTYAIRDSAALVRRLVQDALIR